MSSLSHRLPKVNTRKEFMDHLDDIINPPKYDEDDYPGRGRLRELKTYMLESNDGFPSQLVSDKISCELINTGLDSMKILRATRKNNSAISEFYLDATDKRFFVLHTNDKSNETGEIIDALAEDMHHTFDYTWFYSDMLKRLSHKEGNVFKGFGVNYSGEFLRSNEDEDTDVEDLALSITGSLAEEMQHLVESKPRIERTIAYNKVRVLRGTRNSLFNSVQDDIHNTGYFAVKRGKSVQDHLQLVDIAKNEYGKTITDVENYRIGIKKTSDRTTVEGKCFDFEFPNKIENLPLFIERMFNSAMPFKLWGLKTKIYDNYFKIMAVDLHTGSPIDFEISNDMMRVYLFKGNCGNTILRLFTNLQMYYDSNTKCAQLS